MLKLSSVMIKLFKRDKMRDCLLNLNEEFKSYEHLKLWKMTKNLKPSMASLVANTIEIWGKCSIPGIILNFRKKIYFKSGTSFLHHISEADLGLLQHPRLTSL